MEPRFKQDFSAVRVHTDTTAARSAQTMDAAAYAAGDNIVFGTGRYMPGTPQGSGLLAHELAHVVQQRAGVAAPQGVSREGDADETAAHRAVADIGAGRPPQLAAAQSSIHRQPAGGLPSLLPQAPIMPQQSYPELLLESFLNRMWDAQSGQKQPFEVSAKVREGLNLIDPTLGVRVGPLTTLDSPKPLIDRLRAGLPTSLNPFVEKVLDRLPEQERKLGVRTKPSNDDAPEPASPRFPPADVPDGPRPGGPDAPQPKGASDAAAKALQAAFEEFRKTKLGQELEKAAKSYVFSKEGIPLVILVAGTALTFVAANDPSLPATPDIPLAEGIKLKIELSRASDLPPLLQDMVHGQTEPGHKPERKIGVSATFTFEALGEAAKSVGHFFGEAAGWIAKGVVKAGTVIGRAAVSAWPAIGAMIGGALLGAGIGAGIGAAVGNAGLGAGIGAAAGAGLGLLMALVGPVITRKIKENHEKKEQQK